MLMIISIDWADSQIRVANHSPFLAPILFFLVRWILFIDKWITTGQTCW